MEMQYLPISLSVSPILQDKGSRGGSDVTKVVQHAIHIRLVCAVIKCEARAQVMESSALNLLYYCQTNTNELTTQPTITTIRSTDHLT